MATGYSVMDALNKQTKAGIDDTTPRARFRTKDLSIFKIYANEGNFYPQEDIEQKAGEILAIGLLENLVVKYEPKEAAGEYKLISGERRWRALHLLVERGHKEFEFATCNITAPTTTQEEKVALIIANSHRSKDIDTMIHEEQELKATLEDMKANGIELKGYNLQSGRLRDTIAEMLNISKTKVAQIEAVNNNLIPEFREEMRKNRLTFSAAYELSGMSSDEQREALGVLVDTGELSYQTIKDMKEKKAAQAAGEQVEGQINLDDVQQPGETPLSYHGNVIGEDAEEQVSDSDTGKYVSYEDAAVNYGMNHPEEHPAAGDDYQTPHPEGITSLCYSCTEYETCNVKTGTCTKCDQYNNRAEAYKTDEQRYSEEQDAIDRETARKLREQAEIEKMEKIPSVTGENGQKIHQIRLGASFFEEVLSGEKSFELRKNDRGYKKGDILEMMEFKDGKNTGRIVRVLVMYMLEDFTGLEDGYCIMATRLVNEKDEPMEYADIKRICADIKANTDGYIDDDDVIAVGKAVEFVKSKGCER